MRFRVQCTEFWGLRAVAVEKFCMPSSYFGTIIFRAEYQVLGFMPPPLNEALNPTVGLSAQGFECVLLGVHALEGLGFWVEIDGHGCTALPTNRRFIASVFEGQDVWILRSACH